VSRTGTVPSMGRRIDVDQLVGTTDIAERLGVASAQVVREWRRRHTDFPAPVAQVGTTLIWAWPEIEAWARATGRLS
jgi:hypothetical protein